MRLPEFKLPWVSIDRTFAEAAEEELRKELPQLHVLKHRKMRAVGWRSGCDDVLFIIEDAPPSCAEVHLTRSGKVEPVADHPTTTIYQSLDDWATKSMIPDFEDLRANE